MISKLSNGYSIRKELQEAVNLYQKKNFSLALDEFIRLLDGDVYEASVFIGHIYYMGEGDVKRDYKKARFYYELSMESTGSIEACLGLIRIDLYGLGCEKDYRSAFKYAMLLSEEDNNMYANYYLGEIYLYGLGEEKNLRKAEFFYKKSFQKGYVFSIGKYGVVLQQRGFWFCGWLYRLKAGWLCTKISIKDPKSDKIRYPI